MRKFEIIADKNAIKIAGIEGFKFSLNSFQNYSSTLSFHSLKKYRENLAELKINQEKLTLNLAENKKQILALYLFVLFLNLLIILLLN
jgi:hypothetical protein